MLPTVGSPDAQQLTEDIHWPCLFFQLAQRALGVRFDLAFGATSNSTVDTTEKQERNNW